MPGEVVTDEERGKALYEHCARGWPKPLGWDNLPCKALWIERAKKAKHDRRVETD